MTTTNGPMASEPDNAAPPSLDLVWDAVEHTIEADDIRELAEYAHWESDEKTVVGVGPRPRPPAPKPPRPPLAEGPASQKMPQSEPPGPFVAADDVTPPVLGHQRSVWVVALPALLVAAAVIVMLVRGTSEPRRPEVMTQVTQVTPSANAGLAVNLAVAGVRVLIDGRDRGAPPVVVRGLEAGPHALMITGPGYAPFEQPITLIADHVSTISPKLTFVRGSIRLDAGDGAEGAVVEVVGGAETREIRQLPARIEVAPGEYEIRAAKTGFTTFSSSVAISPSAPDATVVVVLRAEPKVGRGNGLSGAVAPGATKTLVAAPTPSDPPVAPAGKGSLAISSTPPAAVVLDGRPVGKSPRLVEVPAGTHTVVFVHPKLGRQSVSVDVLPGRLNVASADY